jgi:hypothetical protein
MPLLIGIYNKAVEYTGKNFSLCVKRAVIKSFFPLLSFEIQGKFLTFYVL